MIKKTKQRSVYMMCIIGKTLESEVGIEELTSVYNALHPKQNNRPVSERTISRYNNGEYNSVTSTSKSIGVPLAYSKFLSNTIHTQLKIKYTQPSYMMCVIGKTLEKYMGITKLTTAYNRERLKHHLDPIGESTVKRYNNGYSNSSLKCSDIGVPSVYAEFLSKYATAKFKVPNAVKIIKAAKV